MLLSNKIGLTPSKVYIVSIVERELSSLVLFLIHLFYFILQNFFLKLCLGIVTYLVPVLLFIYFGILKSPVVDGVCRTNTLYT